MSIRWFGNAKQNRPKSTKRIDEHTHTAQWTRRRRRTKNRHRAKNVDTNE